MKLVFHCLCEIGILWPHNSDMNSFIYYILCTEVI